MSTAGPEVVVDVPFERFAGAAAVLTALAGLAYAIAFVVLGNVLLAGLFLTFGGLLATPALVALSRRLADAEPGFAVWAVLLALVGVLGSAIHGGYDLANALTAPVGAVGELPSAVDPRGLLTFGVIGIGLLSLGLLIWRTALFPRGLGLLGCLSGVLLVLLYLGRLIILNPTSPLILAPALLNGFLVSPLLYLWLGLSLLRSIR